ncbi:alpha/beta hydrolase [Gaoshiqia sediminis]|uniref:Alpha/beta hydrolase n=1 Tax=Gaoshiqia sediminis TaxID=2986998 RepID=A0AA41Y8S4_9BACT|nr:alpha/beta hydrolase fold domain-containing protein [Gaoshiqia sediminis]MCW0483975.1 alpha/beta hydrolase [Gaoshiqia sediminis]
MKLTQILFLLTFLGCGNLGIAQQNNLDEDYSSYLSEIRSFYAVQPPFPKITLTPESIKMARKLFDKPQSTVLTPTEKEIDGPYGTIGLRIFQPEMVDAVYLHIHGGGNLWGSSCSDDSINDVLARTCQVAVVSIEYHLAPEYPYPAQIEECSIAAKWLLENSKQLFGTEKILIGGGSAGAQNAAATMLYVRDTLNAASKVLGLCLHYGIYDLSKTPSHRLATNDTPGLNKLFLEEIMRVAYGQFSLARLQSPGFSPLYADLEGLPPTFFLCGTADAFIDDTNFMESRWRMAGNETYLALFPECAHGFNNLNLKIAEVANKLWFDWVVTVINKSE